MLINNYILIMSNLMTKTNDNSALKSLDNEFLLKKTLGMFSTGITIVTTTDENNEPIGMTVNSFASVSLNPALVLWSIDKKQPSYDIFLNATGYAVNVLNKNQKNLCTKFASPVEDKFKNVNWEMSKNGNPLIIGSLAWFDCIKWNYYDGGDHQILVGEVKSYDLNENDPLLYWNGKIS